MQNLNSLNIRGNRLCIRKSIKQNVEEASVCGVLNHIEHNPTRVERGHSRLCSIWNIKDRNLTVLTSMHQIRCNFRSLRDSSIIASRNKVAYVPQSFVTD
ncbi:hypothetical protein [Brucella melitensis]|uniref:hypothetical protein n=1 Tax=Brucella melitensis TaxID=29459 RepID=UPI0009B71E2D